VARAPTTEHAKGAAPNKSAQARPPVQPAPPPVTSDEKTPLRGATSGLWSFAGLAIAIGVVGLLVAMVLVYVQLVWAANERHAEALNRTQLELYTQMLDGRLAVLKKQMASLATAPDTIAALATLDSAAIEAESKRLTAATAYAERIEIVPRGRADVDLTSATPISFTALDVIRRAETQPFVGPEAAQIGARTVFYVAEPVTKDGAVAGVLFAVMSMAYFSDSLGAFDAARGQIAIEQQFQNAAVTPVLTLGGEPGGAEPIKSSLAVPSWTLVLRPGPAQANVSPLALATPFAVALALLLGGIYLSYSRLFRQLESDSSTLLDYVIRILRGRGGNIDRYRLPLFQQVAIAASRHVKASPATDSPDPRGQERPAPPKKRVSAAIAKKAAPTEETDDGDFLEISDSESDANSIPRMEVSESASPVDLGLELDPQIFRAYDIRGIVPKNLNDDVVYWIGRAFAAEARAVNKTRVAVGCDGRLSSDGLKAALSRGLTEGGVDVMDVGLVPTPLLYYATHALETATGIMITGSHNPPEYNGLKMVLAGETLADAKIQRLRERIERNEFTEGTGDVERVEIVDHYVDRVVEDVAVALPLKVVVDCGNGVAGAVAPRLIKELGCEVVPLYCDVDGTFPNHHPDPADPHNMEDLITVVRAEKADLGLAFDGDGDRIGVVTNLGEIVWPDKLLMLFARDIVGRNPGADIIFDVKCSRHLNALISEYGGRPIMWKTGHSHIKAKIKETGALLAGEFSGHICFGERWYGFDDALYSAARLLEIVGGEPQKAHELFGEFPVTFATPEMKIATTETAKFQIIDRLAKEGVWGDGTVTTIDGVRVDYPDGWGLIRASNTSPVLTLRFEADGQTALARIQRVFQTQLQRIDPKLKLAV
jgi:phosphomannomutase/phosphoglucomutase